MNKPRSGSPRLTAFFVLAAAVLVLGSCGGSSSNSSSQQVEAARKQGEEAAHERDKLNNLQHQVSRLKHQVHHQGHTVVIEGGQRTTTVATQENAPSVLRTFHAPSGNVSCEILTNGALCSVGSINETFTFSNGEPAQIDSGAALPDSDGELAPYGATVSAGSITCSIPQSSEPRGITCTDGQSGHGFEASRVPSRQKAY